MVNYSFCKNIFFYLEQLGFALAFDQLNKGLWWKKNLCSDWQHLTICVLIASEVQWFKRVLLHDGGLEPYPALQPHMLDVFLVAFSELFAEHMPS